MSGMKALSPEMEAMREECREIERQLEEARAKIEAAGLKLTEDLDSDPDGVQWTVKGDADSFLRLLGIWQSDQTTLLTDEERQTVRAALSHYTNHYTARREYGTKTPVRAGASEVETR